MYRREWDESTAPMLAMLLPGTRAGGLAACRFDHPDQRSNAIMSSLRMRMSSLGINTERNGPNNWMIETGWVTMTKAERLFLTKENWHVERRFLHYAFPCHQLIWLVQCSVVTVEDCAGELRSVRAE